MIEKTKKRLAVLTDGNVLVGARSRGKGIDIGDLPTDGTYKYDPETESFVPLGFGFGKPRRPSVSRDAMLFLLVDALVEGAPLPEECREWRDWYRDEIRKREEGPPR